MKAYKEAASLGPAIVPAPAVIMQNAGRQLPELPQGLPSLAMATGNCREH